VRDGIVARRNVALRRVNLTFEIGSKTVLQFSHTHTHTQSEFIAPTSTDTGYKYIHLFRYRYS